MLILNKQEAQGMELQISDPDNIIVCTHDGVFHAHEVMQVALFLHKCKSDSSKLFVVRTRDVEFINQLFVHENVYVHDIGMKCIPGWLDHHQQGFMYASLEQMFFEETLTGLSYKQICLLNDVSLGDNGLESCDFVSTFISSFNKSWNENKENNVAFKEAVYAALQMLKNADLFIAIRQREMIRKQGEQDAREVVVKAINEASRLHESFIVLERFMPWGEYVYSFNKEAEKPIMFVVFPDATGNGYRLQAVSKSKESYENIKDIDAIPGELGCTFIHNNKFIAGFKTQLDAINCACKSAE